MQSPEDFLHMQSGQAAKSSAVLIKLCEHIYAVAAVTAAEMVMPAQDVGFAGSSRCICVCFGAVLQVFYLVCYEQYRPPTPAGMPEEYAELMRQCWSQDWETRPGFSDISPRLQVCLLQHPLSSVPKHLAVLQAAGACRPSAVACAAWCLAASLHGHPAVWPPLRAPAALLIAIWRTAAFNAQT